MEEEFGGRDRDRTCDLMLAKHALSQLSYTPTTATSINFKAFATVRILRNTRALRRCERLASLTKALLAGNGNHQRNGLGGASSSSRGCQVHDVSLWSWGSRAAGTTTHRVERKRRQNCNQSQCAL